MGLAEDRAASAIRISLSRYTTAGEVETALAALADVRREVFVPARR